MYKSILVPVESSHIGESAAIVEMAKRYGNDDTKIHLLTVFEEVPKWAQTNLPKDLVNDSIQAIEQELQAVAQKAGANVEAHVKVGHSYKTILDVAHDTGVDLIIVDSHQPGVQDYFLGSTAAKVVRHARCSVLVMR